MKSFWGVFSLAFSIAFLFLFVFQSDLLADEEVPRADNKETSTLKAKVPMSRELSRQLEKREKELSEQEKIISEREERLKIEAERVRAEIKKLAALQKAHKEALEKEKQIADDSKERLVKTFESMAPKKAAPIVSSMEDPMAVELLMAMKEKSVAAILEQMDSERAMLISTLIAGRKPALSSGGEGKLRP